MNKRAKITDKLLLRKAARFQFYGADSQLFIVEGCTSISEEWTEHLSILREEGRISEEGDIYRRSEAA